MSRQLPVFVSKKKETCISRFSSIGLQVHSALLTLGSAVLHDAVQLAEKKQGLPLHVPLPATPTAEAEALVHLLYSQKRESYASGQTINRLVSLAKVCQRFAFSELVSILDVALTRLCGPSPLVMPSEPFSKEAITPANVVGLYWEARAERLPHFEAACAHYIGQHVANVAQATRTDPLSPVLQAAAVSEAASQKRRTAFKDLAAAVFSAGDRRYDMCVGGDSAAREERYRRLINKLMDLVANLQSLG